MKKISIVLSFILCGSLSFGLVGCGASESSSNAQVTANEETGETSTGIESYTYDSDRPERGTAFTLESATKSRGVYIKKGDSFFIADYCNLSSSRYIKEAGMAIPVFYQSEGEELVTFTDARCDFEPVEILGNGLDSEVGIYDGHIELYRSSGEEKFIELDNKDISNIDGENYKSIFKQLGLIFYPSRKVYGIPYGYLISESGQRSLVGGYYSGTKFIEKNLLFCYTTFDYGCKLRQSGSTVPLVR